MKRFNSTENPCNQKEKRIACKFCTKRFAKPYLRGFHVYTVHDKIKAYACKEENCNFVAVKRYNLTQHEMARHKKQAPFKCSTCSYVSSRKQPLLQHKCTRHECTFCHQKFRWKKQLKIHIKGECMRVGQKRNSSANKGKSCKEKCTKTKVAKEKIRLMKLEWTESPLPTTKEGTTEGKQKVVIYEGSELSRKEYRSAMLEEVVSLREVKTKE
jgi:hypothetical protein